MDGTRRERLAGCWWLAVRCIRLLAVLPVHLERAWSTSRRLLAAYHRTVSPFVYTRVETEQRRAEVDDRLAGWAMQGGYLVDSYARLAGCRNVDEVAVVAGSFMRLYDDVLDERTDGRQVGERLARLFAGQEIVPGSDVEAIVIDLYHWLAQRVSHYHREALYNYLDEVHQIQLDELNGGKAQDSDALIRRTVRKGGAGMAILAGLANPRIEQEEFQLLHRLGGLLQLIDDYDDAFEDRAFNTSATFSRVPFGALAAELRQVSGEILAFYGTRRQSRSFVDGLCIWLVLVRLRRLRDLFRPGRLESAGLEPPRRRLAMISFRKAHIR